MLRTLFSDWETLPPEIKQILRPMRHDQIERFFSIYRDPKFREQLLRMSPDRIPGVIESLDQERSKLWKGIGIFLAFSIVIGGAFLWVHTHKVDGSFQATGGVLGTFSFQPADCQAGLRRGFFGVTLLGDDKQGGAILLMDDPVRGKLVVVHPPHNCQAGPRDGCNKTILQEKSCRVIKMEFEKSAATRYTEGGAFSGEAKIDCSDNQGGRLQGEVSFQACL